MHDGGVPVLEKNGQGEGEEHLEEKRSIGLSSIGRNTLYFTHILFPWSNQKQNECVSQLSLAWTGVDRHDNLCCMANLLRNGLRLEDHIKICQQPQLLTKQLSGVIFPTGFCHGQKYWLHNKGTS